MKKLSILLVVLFAFQSSCAKIAKVLHASADWILSNQIITLCLSGILVNATLVKISTVYGGENVPNPSFTIGARHELLTMTFIHTRMKLFKPFYG